MTKNNDIIEGDSKKQLTITRIFNAPPKLVFKTWTDAAHVRQWWGPHGFTNPVCELDARPGGSIYIDMTAPDGVVFPMEGEFKEIDEPHCVVFTSTAFKDEEGNNQLENLNTVTFTEVDATTKMNLRVVVLKSSPEVDAALDGMEEGWNQSLDKLAEYLEKQKSINN